MTPETMTGAPYIAAAATVVQLQRVLKDTDVYRRFVAAFPGADKWAHWLFAGAASLIGATGIHIAWSWNVATGGTLHATLPGLADMLHGLWDWFTVYIMQHTIYQATHQSPGPMQVAVDTLPPLSQAVQEQIMRDLRATRMPTAKPTEEKQS